MEEVGISDLRRLIPIIKEKYNYDFSNYASSSFKRRVTRILELKNISVDTLIDMITTTHLPKEDFLHEITVNVTEMFRDPSMWKAMRTVIPQLMAGREKIRLWHAGCASGEEVYSMVILLSELELLDKVEIIASDIDKSILERAKSGKISIKNMEINKSNYLRFSGSADFGNYFTETKECFQIDKALLKNVSFREIDLVSAVPFSKFDLILCRNVMIYFNQVLQNNVLNLFYDSLFMNGNLTIGTKESISSCDVFNKFTSVNAEEKIFRKYK